MLSALLLRRGRPARWLPATAGAGRRRSRPLATSSRLRDMLERVAAGELTPDLALEEVHDLSFERVGNFAKLDHYRALRTGFPEVVFGAGKTPEQLRAILESLVGRSDVGVAMATRVSLAAFEEVRASSSLRELAYHPLSRICYVDRRKESDKAETRGVVTVVSAGTADLPVAEEAALTAELHGFAVERVYDVGVAGLQRLIAHLPTLRSAEVLVVVAGMEGALPSVVGGLVDCPVIAVPTSVGYGASLQGVTPLLAMLSGCAPGVGVVNIDNGFGGAVLAIKCISKRAERTEGEEERTEEEV